MLEVSGLSAAYGRHRALDSVRNAGHDAWLVGEIVDAGAGVTIEGG